MSPSLAGEAALEFAAMSIRLWNQAAGLPVPAGATRRAAIVALPPGTPDVVQLFEFMRDAELRFGTLRMRIQERTIGSRGEQLRLIEVVLRHPGQARVTTSDPGRGLSGNYQVWLSDGETVRTYSGVHRLGTRRPVRPTVEGLDNRDLPGMSTVYRPLTALQAESLADAFVHPAGFCQNVLATGDCSIAGTADQAGREALVLECAHPRSADVWADRPEHRLQVTVDRETGVITRLIEMVGDQVTRDAEVVSLEPDAPLPAAAFDFTLPTDATLLY